MRKRMIFGTMAMLGHLAAASKAKAQFKPCVWPNTCSANTVSVKEAPVEINPPCQPNTLCLVSR